MSGRPVKRGNQDVNLASSSGLKIGQDEIFFPSYIFLLPKTKSKRKKEEEEKIYTFNSKTIISPHFLYQINPLWILYWNAVLFIIFIIM